MAANEADAPATLSEVTAAPKAVVFKSSRNRGNIRKRERVDSGDERPVSTSPAPANSAAGDESSSAGPVVEETPEVVAYVLRPASRGAVAAATHSSLLPLTYGMPPVCCTGPVLRRHAPCKSIAGEKPASARTCWGGPTRWKSPGQPRSTSGPSRRTLRSVSTRVAASSGTDTRLKDLHCGDNSTQATMSCARATRRGIAAVRPRAWARRSRSSPSWTPTSRCTCTRRQAGSGAQRG